MIPRSAVLALLYGGHGATQSSTIAYEIEPGGRLGWHTDATEETQVAFFAAAMFKQQFDNVMIAPSVAAWTQRKMRRPGEDGGKPCAPLVS